MDLYGTTMLNGLVARLRPNPTFFLDTFFPEVITHDTESVHFDVAEDKPRITPFVSPLIAGKVVSDIGFATKEVRPAYVKDKRVHNPEKALKRLAGEALTGGLTNEQRLQLRLTSDLQDQNNMWIRRLEVMAAEAIISGTQTIIGDGLNAVVSFGRASGNTVALTGSDAWNDSGKTDRGADLEAWDTVVYEATGFNVTDFVMSVDVWQNLRGDQKVMDLLDKPKNVGTIDLNLTPTQAVEGLVYRGMYGQFRLWTYSLTYIDSADGVTKNAMPAGTIVGASRAVAGVRHFGAIKDLAAGVVAMEKFVKSWTEEEPSVRYLLLQSAPLMVPYRPNASIKISVFD